MGFGKLSMRSGQAIQTVYDSLASIPSQDLHLSVRNPSQCQHMRSCLEAMNKVTLADLGFEESDIDALDEKVCANIAVNKDFHIAVFLIPKGHTLPLHDHPRMTVLSKVVRGELSLKAYSFAFNEDGSIDKKDEAFAAHQVCNSKKTADDASWYLTPSQGNIHEFTAEKSCVIFDCLLPPYDEPDRPCNFYSAQLDSGGDNNNSEGGSTSENAGPLYWLHPKPENPSSLPHTVEYPGFRPAMKKNRAFNDSIYSN
jgi:PCO_ADO